MFEWSTIHIAFAPFVPFGVVALGALGAALLAAAGLWLGMRGVWLRLWALSLIVVALSNPSFVREQRAGLDDIVPVVLDNSGSQNIGDRRAQMDEARHALEKQFSSLDHVVPRFIDAAGPARDEDGTFLFSSLNEALSDVPPERVAGVIMLTDGQVHDVPERSSFGLDAPLHVLLTGHEGERDRRIELVDAPRFGLVGKEQMFAVRVIDTQPDHLGIDLIVRRDGQEISRRRVLSGEIVNVPVRVDHAGTNVIEFDVPVLEGELTPLNNKVISSLEGVRDKLKVLLVSGEPHAGERMWRNLLTADANVDLIHFTILRPPEKQDSTPINELSLIAFPTAELFGRRIREFDLIVFDRYSNQTILPPLYFENIVRYVHDGGALLMAVGPDYAGVDGLYFSPLGKLAPARPDGSVTERAFRPKVSEIGARHPVTRDLIADEASTPWGQWFRQINAVMLRGSAVLSGADERPLLVLSREEKGRVGLLLSDQMWLWARGFDGGGPYLDVLRRTSHWLMKEPEREEEALRAHAHGRTLSIERQSLRDDIEGVDVEAPSGAKTHVHLQKAEPGLWRADAEVPDIGLYRVSDEALSTLINVGADNPREFRDVISTADVLRPLTEATGGSVRRLDQGHGVTVPRLVMMSESSSYAGSDFIGLHQKHMSEVKGVVQIPFMVGAIGLLLLLGSLIVSWLWEGRRSSSQK